jgi:NADPH:quinone reductase-like Zn-dependent oxidoreductase
MVHEAHAAAMRRGRPDAEVSVRSWVLTGERHQPMRLEDRAEPALAPSQVRVEVLAAALNYRDVFMFDEPQRPGLVPLSDGAGEVTEVGSGVTDLRPGDRVVGGFFAEWIGGPPRRANLDSALGGDLDGVLSERVVLEAAAVAKIPRALSFAEAATFPCAGVTAWHGLMGHEFPVAQGDTVLTLGSGGVSVFALQIAKLAGAAVIATSSSPAKLERLRELGADVLLDYTAADWDAAAIQATGGRGVDFIVETGGAATLGRSLRSCAVGGCVTLVGLLSGQATDADAGLIHERSLTLRSIYVGPVTMLRDCLAAFAASGVRPVIDRVFGFAEAPAAFGYLRSGSHLGKIVIER